MSDFNSKPRLAHDALVCPWCGGTTISYEVVTVFDRAEDAPHVRETAIEGDSIESKVVVAATSDNPSPRRNGVTLYFYCEDCDPGRDEGFTLEIAQHKGQTLIKWRKPYGWG